MFSNFSALFQRSKSARNSKETSGETSSQYRDRWARYGVIPDDIVSFLMPYIHRMSPPHPNTWKDVDQYYRRSLDELFPPTEAPTAVRRRPVSVAFNHFVEAVTFRSTFEPICRNYAVRHNDEYIRNHEVVTRGLRGMFKRRRKAVIYVHGWMQPGGVVETHTFLPFLGTSLGADVFQMDLPFHGARKSFGDIFHGEYFWSADLVRTLEAVRQAVADIRTLMKYLRSIGYEEVSLVGVSLGGVLGLITACVEEDFDAIIPLVAHLDLGEAVAHSPILIGMREDLRYCGISIEQVLHSLDEVGLANMTPIMDVQRLMIIVARDDKLLNPRASRDLWRRWGCPPYVELPGGHLTIIPHAPTIGRLIKQHLQRVRSVEQARERVQVPPVEGAA